MGKIHIVNKHFGHLFRAIYGGIIFLIILGFAPGGKASVQLNPIAKPILLITTDIGGDPDDQQSLTRLRVYDINDQDGLYTYITKEFPGIFYILASAPEGADKREGVYRGMYLGGEEDLTSREWLESHVCSNHGIPG